MKLTLLNENINLYFQEIRKNSSLTRDEEITLFSRIALGDRLAETQVFNKMAKMAVMVAKTYTNDPILIQDLIQEANYGILVAIKKFDPALGFRFSSYARWWMKAQITTFINGRECVHPANMKVTYLARKIREDFYKVNQRDITEYELMDALEELGEIVTDPSVILNIKMERLDLPDENGVTMMDAGEVAMTTSQTNNFMYQMEDESVSDTIKRLMARLTPRERTIVKMKFGIGYDYEMDYATITEKYNQAHPEKPLTMERIRQICVGALKKMK